MQIQKLDTGEVTVDIEARRIDEEFDDWMQEQGIGDHQLQETNDMLEGMIKAQESLYKK